MLTFSLHIDSIFVGELLHERPFTREGNSLVQVIPHCLFILVKAIIADSQVFRGVSFLVKLDIMFPNIN